MRLLINCSASRKDFSNNDDNYKIKELLFNKIIYFLFLHELLQHEIFQLDEHKQLKIVQHHVNDD